MKDPRSKKAIAAGLSLTLALGSVPAVAFADNAAENNDGDAAQQGTFGYFALNANGGQFANGEASMLVEANEDGTVDLPTPTLSGYTFVGWYSQADMSQIPEDMQQYYKLNPDAPRAGSWFAAWEEGEEAQTYVVNYVANGGQFADGSDLASVAIDSEGLLRQPAAPTREGYTFAGWYWHADYSNYTEEQKEADKVDFSKPVAGDSDVNIFAQWAKNQEQDEVNVLYVANGGQFLDGNETMQGVADSDGMLRQPPAPTREGYTFAGWYWHADLSQYTDEQKEADKVDFSKPVEKSAPVYAQWIKNQEQNEINVTYVANGGQFADGQEVQQGLTDSEGFMRQPMTPTREGYTFAGWYWHADYSNYTEEQKEADKVDFSKPLDRDGVMYAQWVKNAEQNEINVLYVANGGQFADGNDTMMGMTDSEGFMRQPAAPTREGYTFAGWYWHQDLSQYTDEQKEADKVDFSKPVEKSAPVYAQWIKNQEQNEINVTYVANGGQFADGQEVQQGLTDSEGFMRQPMTPTREGYTFAGWYWHADYSNYTEEQKEADKVDFSKPLDRDGVMYAQWVKNAEQNEINVLYVANGGQFADGNDTMMGMTDSEGFMRQPAAPTREGYTFAGWYWHQDLSQYTDEQKEADKVDFTESVAGMDHATMYAQWTKDTEQNEIDVMYVANGGQFATGETFQQGMTDADGFMRQPMTPTREGYTFAGWYWVSSLDGLTDEQKDLNKVDFEQSVAGKDHVTMFAQWTKDAEQENLFNVMYVANGGQFVTGEDVQQGVTDSEGLMRQPAAPTREGYTFDGWYWHADLSQYTAEQKALDKVDFTAPIDRDATMYAQWSKVATPAEKKITVKFVDNFNKTESTVEITEGEAVAQPKDPSYKGWSFEGWSSTLTDEQGNAKFTPVDFSKVVADEDEDGVVTYYAFYTEDKAETPADTEKKDEPKQETTEEDASAAEEPAAEAEAAAIPQTGDATNAAAVAGVAGIAGLLAAAAALIRRRFNN